MTVTIAGEEDAPVITGSSSGAVAEDGISTATGTIVTTDVDAIINPVFTAQTNVAGAYGSFAIYAAGVWTYNLDNTAAQGLSDGESFAENFTVNATTQNGETVSQTVTITVNGVNEPPIAEDDSFTVNERNTVSDNVITPDNSSGDSDSNGGDGIDTDTARVTIEVSSSGPDANADENFILLTKVNGSDTAF